MRELRILLRIANLALLVLWCGFGAPIAPSPARDAAGLRSASSAPSNSRISGSRKRRRGGKPLCRFGGRRHRFSGRCAKNAPYPNPLPASGPRGTRVLSRTVCSLTRRSLQTREMGRSALRESFRPACGEKGAGRQGVNRDMPRFSCSPCRPPPNGGRQPTCGCPRAR